MGRRWRSRSVAEPKWSPASSPGFRFPALHCLSREKCKINPAGATTRFHFSGVTRSRGGQDPSPKGEKQIWVEAHVESVWSASYKWCLPFITIIFNVLLIRFCLFLPFVIKGKWRHELWVSLKIVPQSLVLVLVLVSERARTCATCVRTLGCCVCAGSQLFCCLNHRACCLDVLSVLVSALWNKVQNIKEITRNILVARIVIAPEGKRGWWIICLANAWKNPLNSS